MGRDASGQAGQFDRMQYRARLYCAWHRTASALICLMMLVPWLVSLMICKQASRFMKPPGFVAQETHPGRLTHKHVSFDDIHGTCCCRSHQASDHAGAKVSEEVIASTSDPHP